MKAFLITLFTIAIVCGVAILTGYPWIRLVADPVDQKWIMTFWAFFWCIPGVIFQVWLLEKL